MSLVKAFQGLAGASLGLPKTPLGLAKAFQGLAQASQVLPRPSSDLSGPGWGLPGPGLGLPGLGLGWELSLEAGIWASRGGGNGEGRRKGENPPLWESIGHQPLRGRCSKVQMEVSLFFLIPRGVSQKCIWRCKKNLPTFYILKYFWDTSRRNLKDTSILYFFMIYSNPVSKLMIFPYEIFIIKGLVKIHLPLFDWSLMQGTSNFGKIMPRLSWKGI